MPDEEVHDSKTGWVVTTVPTGCILPPGEAYALRDSFDRRMLLDWFFRRYENKKIRIDVTILEEAIPEAEMPRRTIRDIGAPR